MNSGPTGSRTQSVTMRPICASAAASSFQPMISVTSSSWAGCRAPQRAMLSGCWSSTQRTAKSLQTATALVFPLRNSRGRVFRRYQHRGPMTCSSATKNAAQHLVAPSRVRSGAGYAIPVAAT
jgi:hypothetical protein